MEDVLENAVDFVSFVNFHLDSNLSLADGLDKAIIAEPDFPWWSNELVFLEPVVLRGHVR